MFVCRVLVIVGCVVATVGVIPGAPAAAATVTDLYVATDGSDTNACTTAAEPCHTIDRAITLAATTGTTVHVAKGNYGTITPGAKKVTVVGVGTDLTTGTVVSDLGAAVAVTDASGLLALKSLAVQGDPAGVYVTAGTVTTSHVVIADTTCAVFMSGGHVTLTDSAVTRSGIVGNPDCQSVSPDPAAMTVNGGDLAMVRSHLMDTTDEPGVVVNDGTFTSRDSIFSDAAYGQTNHAAAVHIAGGAATIARSLFESNDLGLQITGGSTTITDSTFHLANAGISSVGGGHQPSIFRSSLIDAELFGPAVLAGDVLANQYGPACSEEPTDMGYNYGTRGGCTFSAPTSHNGVATLNLASAAADHGGATPTVAMAAPSALINTIPSGATWGPEHHLLCPPGTTDQRGVSRTQGGACDVGAFEAAASLTAVKASSNPSVPGAKVTLTARIVPNTGTFHDPDRPGGTVAFAVGHTRLCTATTASGVASCATTKLPAGRPIITASFVSASPFLNSGGTVKLTVGTVARFTSSSRATARVGKRKTITIRAAGVPTPTVVRISGALPKGMRFTAGRGHATISGTPARGTARKYVLHLRATNVRGRTSQTLTLTVAAK